MAESSNARQGEPSKARTPQQNPKMKQLQSLPRTSSRKDLQFPGAADISPAFHGDGDEQTVPLPPWFQHVFPLLSDNDTFLQVYVFLATVALTVKAALLLDLFLKWITFLKLVFRPTIVTAQWSWWLFSSLFIKPGLYIVLSIASILGITNALSTLLVKLIHAIDFYGDKLMTTIGILIAYIKEQWDQINHDVLDAFNKLKKWAKETLETSVRAMKYVVVYLNDLLKMILPTSVYDWITRWISILSCTASTLYSFSKYLLTTFEKVLHIITEAWNSVLPDPHNPSPQKVFGIDAKEKDLPKSSAGSSKPVEAVTSPSALPAEESTKPRKPQ